MDKKLIIIFIIPFYLFASNLGDNYAQKEYYFEAITEYKRQLFEESYTEVDKLLYKISLLYYRSGKKMQAEKYSTRAIFNNNQSKYDIDCCIILARIHWDNYDYKKFRKTLDYLKTKIGTKEQETIEYIKAWSYYYNAEWEQGNKIIASLNLDFQKQLLADIEDVDQVPQKSKVLPGIMSLIIPGSGNIYAGDYKNGILSFALVGSIGGSIVWNIIKQAYFVAITKYYFLFTRYSQGSLQNLNNKIEKDNISKIGDYLDKISSKYPDPINQLQSFKTTSENKIFTSE